MKKILDSKFLFILALSIVALIILLVGAFYLFDDSDDVFVKDGYVLNPLSAKNERYLFDKDTSYKVNLSGVVVFNDTDDNEVSVFKDSFLHYMDGSISFLKNGAILDLDSINGSEAVKFYNITNKSIVEKRSDGYVIETNSDNINLKNFMGRISDNKYIVAGSLEAKIPGNEKNITGNYFEIVYNDEGVITIENNNVKYQVTAEGSYIYAGDIIIDLGNKKITQDGNDIMSITAITINGDENIEIIPKVKEKKEDNNEGGNGTNNDGNGNGQGGASGNDNTGTGTGNNQTGEDVKEEIKTEDLIVSLKNYERHSTYIRATFEVANQREDDSLVLKITNLDTGKTIDRKYNIEDDTTIETDPLSPDTKYLFTIINERNENKYFQTILKTKKIGIDLEVTYVTSNEIGYRIIADNDSEVKDATITLKKFDEDNDSHGDVVSYYLKNLTKNDEGEYVGIPFQNLESNTIYTLLVDGFKIDSIDNTTDYNIVKTILTLKQTPTFGAMKREVLNDNFKLYIEDVVDNDNAIESYTYYIFDNEENLNNTEVKFNPGNAITSVTKKTAEPVEISINGETILSNHHYLYMLAIEYFDNEKYVEYAIDGRLDLFIADEPLVVVNEIDDEISYDRIGATITINDISCQLAVKGRDCYDDDSTITIDVNKRTGGNDVNTNVYHKVIDSSKIVVDGTTLTFKDNLIVENLEPGKFYIVTVSAAQKDKLNEGIRPLSFGLGNKNEIMTLHLSSFNATWSDGTSSNEHAIHGGFQLTKDESNHATLSSDIGAGLIKKVVLKLYDGPYKGNLANQNFLTEVTIYDNIKRDFYDNEFEISEKKFGINDIEELKRLTKDKTGGEERLSAFYTVTVDAYYENDVPVSIKTEPKHFAVAEYLRSEITDPTLRVEETWKSYDDGFNDNLTIGEGGAAVGYKVYVHLERSEYDDANMTLKSSRVYVYDEDGKVAFYIDNSGATQQEISTNLEEMTDNDYKVELFMGDGVKNGTPSEVMVRGKAYYIQAEITYDMDIDGNIKTEKQLSNAVLVKAKKEAPRVTKSYIYESTEDGKITYKYNIVDIDNAWHSIDDVAKLYYRINDNEEENSVDVVTNSEEEKAFTISGLNNSDSYSYTLSYKYDLYDTGNSEEDTIDVTIGKENRFFDGYYDANAENNNKYNFRFEVIDRSSNSSEEAPANKVTIKILASDKIIDRILTYKVHLEDKYHNTYDDEIWKLDECDDGTSRCFTIEYMSIKNMKSLNNDKNYITVSIDAIYDNGLMGYGYEDKIGEGKKYPYMIMQLESTKDSYGRYFIINNSSYNLNDPSRDKPGYDKIDRDNRIKPLAYAYYYFNGSWLYYESQYNKNDKLRSTYQLGSNGYWLAFAGGTITPKMVSVAEMDSDKDSFYFSSITPTVTINKKISLLNGVEIMMKISGADTEDIDFCADTNGNTCNTTGTKKLYIDIWDNLEDANRANVVRPTYDKIELTSSINGSYTAHIDGLLHNHTYYYRIYVYQNDGGNKIPVQMLDDDAQVLVDSFTTKDLSGNNGVLSSAGVSYGRPQDGAYNEKELIMKINMNSYDTETTIPYDFNVAYKFCKDEDCNLNGSKLFEKDMGNATQAMESRENIDSYKAEYGEDYFEYGRDYHMYVYISYESYKKNANGTWTTEVKEYPVDNQVAISNLTVPKTVFEVTRSSDYDPDANYAYIDVTVENVYDNDLVLKDGRFYIKVTKEDGEEAEGILLLDLDDDGIYTPVGEVGGYSTRYFSADKTSENSYIGKTIRIGGLETDTKYKVTVSGSAYMNNSGATEKEITIKSGADNDGDLIWTANAYGVALGKDVTFTTVNPGFIGIYEFASNLPTKDNPIRNVKKMTVDVKDQNGALYFTHVYTIGENDKYFLKTKKNNMYVFYINYDDNPSYEGLTNKDDKSYLVTTEYFVWDENIEDEVSISRIEYRTPIGDPNSILKELDNDSN